MDIGGEAEERSKIHEVKSTHDTGACGKQNYMIISRMETRRGEQKGITGMNGNIINEIRR